MLRNKEKVLVDRTKDRVYKDKVFALLEVKHSTSKGLNHAVNFSVRNIIQQEVPKSCSEQEMNIIPEVRETNTKIRN